MSESESELKAELKAVKKALSDTQEFMWVLFQDSVDSMVYTDVDEYLKETWDHPGHVSTTKRDLIALKKMIGKLLPNVRWECRDMVVTGKTLAEITQVYNVGIWKLFPKLIRYGDDKSPIHYRRIETLVDSPIVEDVCDVAFFINEGIHRQEVVAYRFYKLVVPV